MTEKEHKITVEADQNKQRIDKILAQCVPDLTRSRVQSLIEAGHVLCGQAPVANSSYKVKTDDELTITIPEPVSSEILAQDIPLDIIYEDNDLLVINKAAGMTVHPAPGNYDGTLVNALLHHCGDSLSGIGGVSRPGIVHRLDKDTSGLMVAAKHDAAHQHLSAQLADRSLKRTYNALIWGMPLGGGTINGNIDRSNKNRQKMAVVKEGGREATTHFTRLKLFHELISLVECRLETGRTHQIRVHMQHHGFPLLCDPLYGMSTQSQLNKNIHKVLSDETHQALLAFKRQALHAKEIGFIHPTTNETMHFTIDLPQDMLHLIDKINTE